MPLQTLSDNPSRFCDMALPSFPVRKICKPSPSVGYSILEEFDSSG